MRSFDVSLIMPEKTIEIEKTIETPVIWHAIMVIMTSLMRLGNDKC